MNSDSEKVYVDILLTNSLQTESNDRVAVTFQENRNTPILTKTSDYYLSIIRFSLNTETLPVFQPSMQIGSTTDTVYSITLEYNGVLYQQYMQFIPQATNTTDPDEQLYVYSYQYVIYLVNNCFNTCFAELDALTSLPTNKAPIMTFDVDSQLCSIAVDPNFYGYNETGKLNIYMNYAMYALFNSLPAMQINANVSGKDYQLNNMISPDPSTFLQEYSTIALWNPISSIIFTSNLLPVSPNATPPIQIYRNGTINSGSSSSNFLSVITDFIGNELTFVPYIQYSATVYRYISLTPANELRNIDMQVYWQNKNNGILKPIYLGTAGSCTLKLMFSKKNTSFN